MAAAESGSEETRIRDIATSRIDQIGGTIAALSDIVRAFGCIERRHMVIVADVFNLTVAEIRGIVSFYTDLRTKPVGTQTHPHLPGGSVSGGRRTRAYRRDCGQTRHQSGRDGGGR